jgi:hypothetical protein
VRFDVCQASSDHSPGFVNFRLLLRPDRLSISFAMQRFGAVNENHFAAETMNCSAADISRDCVAPQ